MPIGHSRANMQLIEMAPSGGQFCNSYQWRHLVAKFGTNVRGAILRPNLHLCKWCHLVANFATNASGAIWWQVVFFLAGEITEVKKLISWVGCASGNVSSVYWKLFTRSLSDKNHLYFCFTWAQNPIALMTRFSKPNLSKETTSTWLASQPLLTLRSRQRTLSSSPLLLLLNHSSTSASLQLSFEFLL